MIRHVDFLGYFNQSESIFENKFHIKHANQNIKLPMDLSNMLKYEYNIHI